jgi:hypothetical protein
MTTQRQRRTSGRRRGFNIDELTARFPTRADDLRELYIRFQERTFLPALHDVKIFLYRHSAEPRALRARSAALAEVFNLLAHLPDRELGQVLAEARMRASGKSDLEIVADAILGRSG